MTDHREIIARADCVTNSLFEIVFVQNRSHIEIIGHHQASKAQLIAQELGDNAGRERCGRFLWFKTWVPSMANHHAVDLAGKSTKNRELVRVQLIDRSLDQRQIMVRINCRSGIPWEMLATTRDPFPAQCVIKGACQSDHLRDITTITSASK